MNDSDAVIAKIDSLEGREQDHVPWLMALLGHDDSVVRFAAIKPLIYRCAVPGLCDKLWAMLGSEPDEDVLLLVITALSESRRGSRDAASIRRFQAALERVGGGLPGTREALDDAKLRIIFGCGSKELVNMSPALRKQKLLEADRFITTG